MEYLVYIFTVGINSKSFTRPVHFVQETSPKCAFWRYLTSGRHNSQWLQIAGNVHSQIISLRDVKFSFLPLESIPSHSPGMYTPYKKPPQIFCDVSTRVAFCRCPTLRNKTVNTKYCAVRGLEGVLWLAVMRCYFKIVIFVYLGLTWAHIQQKFLLHTWHLFRNSYCPFWNSYYTFCALSTLFYALLDFRIVQTQKQTMIYLVSCYVRLPLADKAIITVLTARRRWRKVNTKAVICACKHMRLAPKSTARDEAGCSRLARAANSEILL